MCRRTHQVVAFGGGWGGDACRALGSGCRGLIASATAISDFWKAYVAVLPEETHRSVGQGDRGDRAHEALVQNPVPAHCALRPRDPLLLQEKLVARDRVDPLVHRRVQPLMLRVARIGA